MTGRLPALIVLALGLVSSSLLAQETLVERTVYLMGTRADLRIESASRADGLARLDDLVGDLEQAEAALSTWRDDSLLGRLNTHPVGQPFAAPNALCELITRLAHWRAETGGTFDPAVGSLIEAYDLRGVGRHAARDARRAAMERAGLDHLQVEVAPCRVTRDVDVWLDAGAFGKGLALDRVRAANASAGPWLIDLGGQLAVGGESPAAWPIAVAHPERRDHPVLRLTLRVGSLAVSGGSERDRVVDGRSLGHVLDPRVGRPVSRRVSVAVWHEEAFVADVLSTALYVMGVEAGRAWAEARGLAVCFLVPHPSGAGDVDLVATEAFRIRFP